jgi:hypothetical protein
MWPRKAKRSPAAARRRAVPRNRVGQHGDPPGVPAGENEAVAEEPARRHERVHLPRGIAHGDFPQDEVARRVVGQAAPAAIGGGPSAEPPVRAQELALARADGEIVVQRQHDPRVARRQPPEESDAFQPELQRMMEVDDVRPQPVHHRAERGGQAVRVHLAQEETVEMRQVDQRLVRCPARRGLKQRAGPRLAQVAGHRGEEQALQARHGVAHPAEQVARHHLGAARLQRGVVVRQRQQPHHAAPPKRRISAAMSRSQRR